MKRVPQKGLDSKVRKKKSERYLWIGKRILQSHRQVEGYYSGEGTYQCPDLKVVHNPLVVQCSALAPHEDGEAHEYRREYRRKGVDERLDREEKVGGDDQSGT